MCFLTVKDHAKAEEHLWTCDPEDADTIYLQFCLDLAMGMSVSDRRTVRSHASAPQVEQRRVGIDVPFALSADSSHCVACDAVKKLGKASNCTERHLSLAL